MESPIPNNSTEISWTNALEKGINLIRRKSQAYKILHIRSAKKMECLYNKLIYAAILTGPLAGLCTGLTLSLGCRYIWFDVAGTITSVLSGILVAISKNGEYEKKIELYRLSASRFSSIEENIRQVLTLERKDRPSALAYFEWINKSFRETFDASPLISGDVYQLYLSIARKKNLYIPDEYREDSMSELSRSSEEKGELVLQIEGETDVGKDVGKDVPEIYKLDSKKYSNGQMVYEMNRLGIKV